MSLSDNARSTLEAKRDVLEEVASMDVPLSEEATYLLDQLEDSV